MTSEKDNNAKGVSRRDFLKGVGITGAAGVAASLSASVAMPDTANAKAKDVDYRPRKKYEVNKPHYEKDIVGPLEKFDERDIPFSKMDYIKKYPEIASEYYKDKPEEYDFYKKLAELPGLGHVGDQSDTLMMGIQAGFVAKLGHENIVDGKPNPKKVELSPQRAAEKIKGFAKHLGADLVAIGPLNQTHVYSHVGRINYPEEQEWGKEINLTHKSAISIGIAMNNEMIKTGPVVAEPIETMKAYAKSAAIAVQLVDYIRALGYPARAHHFRNYLVNCVPIAVDGGMGEVGRHTFLITQEYGNCLRLATVTTDIPLEYDKPVDIGAQAFCEDCKICADSCPSGAIPTGEKVEVRGVKKWKLDDKKCYQYWNETGTDCGQCIAVCPWNKPHTWIHKFPQGVISKTSLAGNIFVPMEKVFYGEFQPQPVPNWLEKPSDVYKEVNKKYNYNK